MDKVPLNKSMIEAETSHKHHTRSSKKKKRRGKKNGHGAKVAAQAARERSNTAEEEVKGDIMSDSDKDCDIKINETYVPEDHHKPLPNHNNSGDNSTKLKTQDEDETHDKKPDVFISRVEDDEEAKMFHMKNKPDFDFISDQESELSYTVSLTSTVNGRCLSSRGGQDEVTELYIDEPKWLNSSTSWVKPPHRVYKIKAVWSNPSTFDTEVRRRYRHFVWLRQVLIREYESCAVPILPDKSVFEKVFGHSSDFIKERMRKLKHFLTIIISHRELKSSENFKSFLCEKDKVFKATVKTYEAEEMEAKAAASNSKGWMSLASSSFGKVFNKAKEWELDKIIPGVNKLLSSSEDEISGHDLLIKNIEEKLEVLRTSLVEFYKLASSVFQCRSEEYQMEKQNYIICCDNSSFEDPETSEQVNKYGSIAKDRSENIHNNLSKLKEVIYATESHLVWIESVQDLVDRKHAIGSQITDIKNSIKKNEITSDNIDTCRALLKLTERREDMIKGIIKEMDKLRLGTRDFYARFVHSGFMKVAQNIP